ncbi:hypothetical protein [Pelagibaculum spongiae]|nr:hypothetical protein [Pelagibaculum spongiae]
MEACLVGSTCCRHNIVKESFEDHEKMPPLWAWTALTISLSAITWAILAA